MKTWVVVALLSLSSIAGADYVAGFRSYQSGDYAKAIAEWVPLAEQGDAKSENAIAYLYLIGKGFTQDYALAAKWYQKAADQGVPVAQCNLGRLYLSGRGNLPRDYTTATTWFEKAADQGYKPCQNYLGYRYLKGEGALQDYVKAEMWFTLAGPGTDQEDANARAETLKHLTPEQMNQAMMMAQNWHPNVQGTPAVATQPLVPTVVHWCNGCAGSDHALY